MVRGRIPVGTKFSARPDRPWGPPSLLYNGYRVFPGGKERPGRTADPSPPSSAAVMEEKSYTSIHPLGHTGPVVGSLYLYLYTHMYIHMYIHTHTHTHTYIYRMSQEECARLGESVPYVKVHRYNPKHLCPKLNGYGDNGQRSLKL